jgi:hypothetical protein
MSITSRLFSIGPRISRKGDSLVAATGWRFGVLTLGAMFRRVVVDANAQTVRIRHRYGWLFGRSRTIPFRQIQSVVYGYEDWSWDANFSFAYKTLDVYQVGLRLLDDREVHLFHFFGEGTIINEGPLPDWFYWPEYAFELGGTQQSESRLFVELLSRMIGVSVQPARP